MCLQGRKVKANVRVTKSCTVCMSLPAVIGLRSPALMTYEAGPMTDPWITQMTEKE